MSAIFATPLDRSFPIWVLDGEGFLHLIDNRFLDQFRVVGRNFRCRMSQQLCHHFKAYSFVEAHRCIGMPCYMGMEGLVNSTYIF